MNKCAAAFLCLFISQNLQAQPIDKQAILTVTNDKNSNVDTLYADSLDGQIQGMEIGQVSFSMSDLAKGVVIYQQNNRAVITLSGKFNALNASNTLTMSYLDNGLFNSYKSCDFMLLRDLDQDWYVENSYNHSYPITSLEIHTWALGVSTIQGLCP